jgi:hypothetical protein
MGIVDRLRETDVRIAVLQERFDAQAMTLRLAKEHCGDVQVRTRFSIFVLWMV